MSLIAELRRRQVFRAAAWYGGIAWIAVQVADTVIPRFGLPDWTVRAVIVGALLGLPLVLLLAWSFDLSIAGLRRETAPTAGTPPAGSTWRIPSLWIALAAGIALTVSAQQAWQRLVRPSLEERPSIAVLPFANLSPDPENAFFADGLHEEVLASLARARGLRVISRTSVQEYRELKRNLREVANALDVSHVLEGSVRRAGDDLRVTLQLIDGRTDEHVWAETYDRKFRDVLTLQRTVADQIVVAIGAVLSPEERRLIAGAAPTVPEAYESYLHALALFDQFAPGPQLETVINLLDQSLTRDPGFALAYALRAKGQIWLAATGYADDRYEVIVTQAREDIERALELSPGLPEALTARGYYHTYVTRDAKRALPDLEAALVQAPSDPDLRNILGLALRKVSRFDEAIENFREAERLTPREERYAYRDTETLTNLSRLREADLELESLQQRFPSSPFPRLGRLYIRFLQSGETAGWREEFDRLNDPTLNRGLLWYAIQMRLATNDVAGLISLLEKDRAARPGEHWLALGLLYTELGEPERARPPLEQLVARARKPPEDSNGLAEGAVALMLLGQRDEALRMADRTLEVAPAAELDIWNHTIAADLRAWVLVRSGVRRQEGYAELERLLGGYDMHPRKVERLSPWRLMRDDPEFRRIIGSKLDSG